MPRVLFPLLLLALPLLLGSCGAPLDATRPESSDHWHADPRPQAPDWGLAQKEYVVLILPQARHAGADREEERQRLAVNLLADGQVFFRGYAWDLETGTAEEREAALHSYAEAMRRLLDDPRIRDREGRSRVPLMFYAGRDSDWRHVRRIWLPLVRDPRIRVRDFQVAVWCEKHVHADTRFDVRAEDGVPPDDALALELTATDGEKGPSLDLRIGEQRWSFGELPAEPPWRVEPRTGPDGTFLARANAVWAEAEATLAARTRPRVPVALRITTGDQELPWAFVVKVLDLLLGADLRDVYLVEEGLHLTLEQPPEPRSYRRTYAPVVTPLVLLLCAVAAALAFWIAFRPLRPRKPRREA